MNVGTRSVLYGAHCWLIHPWFVALGWWRLYGFPWDPRLWVLFCVHDLGYLGKPNMDGPEGETHPVLGARIMGRFDRGRSTAWHDLSMYHSRYLAAAHNMPVSRLCYADKLAIVYTPAWLYLPLVWASGELREYMHMAGASSKISNDKGALAWYRSLQTYMREWVTVHRDGRADTWTKSRYNECT